MFTIVIVFNHTIYCSIDNIGFPEGYVSTQQLLWINLLSLPCIKFVHKQYAKKVKLHQTPKNTSLANPTILKAKQIQGVSLIS